PDASVLPGTAQPHSCRPPPPFGQKYQHQTRGFFCAILRALTGFRFLAANFAGPNFLRSCTRFEAAIRPPRSHKQSLWLAQRKIALLLAGKLVARTIHVLFNTGIP